MGNFAETQVDIPLSQNDYKLEWSPDVHHWDKPDNGGYGFEVISRPDMDAFAKKYGKGISSAYSPWNTNYEDMAKKDDNQESA